MIIRQKSKISPFLWITFPSLTYTKFESCLYQYQARFFFSINPNEISLFKWAISAYWKKKKKMRCYIWTEHFRASGLRGGPWGGQGGMTVGPTRRSPGQICEWMRGGREGRRRAADQAATEGFDRLPPYRLHSIISPKLVNWIGWRRRLASVPHPYTVHQINSHPPESQVPEEGIFYNL